MTSQCKVCRAPLVQIPDGRPRDYCSIPCRRAAEYRLRRYQRRAAEIESRVALLKLQTAGPWAELRDGATGLTAAEEILELETELARIESALGAAAA